MKINIANPFEGTQKLIEIDDERTLRGFYEKRMGAEITADALGDEFKGYVMRIAGGNDKQGFAMKQGILSNGRVRLLMGAGSSLYRCRRTGERHRRSARGCIVGADLSVLNLVRLVFAWLYPSRARAGNRKEGRSTALGDPGSRSACFVSLAATRRFFASGFCRLSSRRVRARSPV